VATHPRPRSSAEFGGRRATAGSWSEPKGHVTVSLLPGRASYQLWMPHRPPAGKLEPQQKLLRLHPGLAESEHPCLPLGITNPNAGVRVHAYVCVSAGNTLHARVHVCTCRKVTARCLWEVKLTTRMS
jgi:hypothetical protein